MSTTPFSRRAARPLAVVATSTALAAMLTACGGDDATTAAATDTQGNQAGQSAQDGADGGPGGRMPGTFGLIAAVNGNVLQVRGQGQGSGQTAVTVTDSTTVTDQAAGTLADVTTGVCVVVRTAETDTSANADDAAPTEVTAASVAVTASDADSACPGGFGGGPGGGDGQRPSGMPTDLPSDFPTTMPSGAPDDIGGGRPGGFGTVGKVTSVSAGGFVVEGMNGDVTVTVNDATTYTHQVAADSSALTQGRCVRVEGDPDDTGAVTATSVSVSDAVNDQCGR